MGRMGGSLQMDSRCYPALSSQARRVPPGRAVGDQALGILKVTVPSCSDSGNAASAPRRDLRPLTWLCSVRVLPRRAAEGQTVFPHKHTLLPGDVISTRAGPGPALLSVSSSSVYQESDDL